ncbi:MAG: hypothetical protein MST10_09725, partial [Lentisphaeria bacterium]|nr:hypothetical protein [Lentisphaeria bacterium]
YAEGEYVHDVDWSCCSLRHVQASRTTGAVGKQYNAVMEKYWKKGIFSSPMNYPTHSVSGPLSVMDSLPNKVSAIGYRNANNDDYFAHSNFSNVTAFYHMDNGACLRIAEYREISGNVGCDDEDFRIFGTSGSYSNLQWRENGRVIPDGTPLENKVTQLDLNSMRDPLPQEVADAFNMMLNKDAKPGDDFIPSGHGGSHPYLVHEFVSSVAENRIPAISAWDAAAYMAMGAAAHKSALKDGELVKVHHFGRAPRNN